MEPQSTKHETTEAPEFTNNCAWYTPLCRVTRASKFLAALTMIILPFVGGYVGWQLGIISNTHDAAMVVTGNDSLTAITTSATNYVDQEFGFSLELPFRWSVKEVSASNTDWYTPQGAEKHLAFTNFAGKSFSVSVFKMNPLQSYFHCYSYRYSPSDKQWHRQDNTKIDRCTDEDVVDGQTNTTLYANIEIAGRPALRQFSINPFSILLPLSDDLGLHVIISNNDDTFDQLDPEVLEILNSLKLVSSPQGTYVPADYTEQMNVTEKPGDLFSEFFVSSGDFAVASVTASAIYGRRLHFISDNPDTQLTGIAQIEFSYHYGDWVTTFIPDEISISKMPVLKDGRKVSFLTTSDDPLCEQLFDCKNVEEILSGDGVYTSPVYTARVKLANPALGYEVIGSDAGTPAYTIGFDRLETISE